MKHRFVIDADQTGNYFGDMLLIDGYGGRPILLDDPVLIRKILISLPPLLGLVPTAGAELYFVRPNVKKSVDPGGGWTGYVVIEESHLAIHTFPRRGFAEIDVSTCQTGIDLDYVLRYFLDAFGFDPERTRTKHIRRGEDYPQEDTHVIQPQCARDVEREPSLLWLAREYYLSAHLDIVQDDPDVAPVHHEDFHHFVRELFMSSYEDEGGRKDIEPPVVFEWEKTERGTRVYIHVSASEDEWIDDRFLTNDAMFTGHIITIARALTRARKICNVEQVDMRITLNDPPRSGLVFRSMS